jgi:cobalt/nickel transport protein
MPRPQQEDTPMTFRTALTTVAALALCGPASAHFGMIIPSDSMVDGDDGRSVSLQVSFSHPFEATGMDLVRPEVFAVVNDGQSRDLLEALQPAEVMGGDGFTVEHALERPGAHVFHMTPEPYWELTEDVFIVHYTKTYVAAFGDDTGWDAEVGLPTEITPLSKPFGLWAGNAFQGVVKVDGAPVPFAEVEVEHWSEDGPVSAPSELMITQTIKADADGVFTYAAPVPGWWGFAALTTSEETMPHEGENKAIELGAVIWVEFQPWPKR